MEIVIMFWAVSLPKISFEILTYSVCGHGNIAFYTTHFNIYLFIHCSVVVSGSVAENTFWAKGLGRHSPEHTIHHLFVDVIATSHFFFGGIYLFWQLFGGRSEILGLARLMTFGI